MKCRFCDNELNDIFLSLGSSPLSNSYLTREQLLKMEPYYPLKVYVCNKCFLVQLEEFESPQHIFNDYAYFSSYSDTWLKHAKDYAAKMIKLFNINNQSTVIEIASNDGYLLQYFIQRGIPVLGIEPAANVAKVAKEKGIPTETVFFGLHAAKELVKKGKYADLIVGNNVLAHVPNLNDFIKGLKFLLKPKGIITLEFPHLMRLIEGIQFDTIYHEHFSYFSLLTLEKVFDKYGLTVFDVEELSTHGGSLRIYVRHQDDNTRTITERIYDLKDRETKFGLMDINFYTSFGEKVNAVKLDMLNFLIKVKKEGKSIVGYGAPAKGNTLINYCGIKTDFLDYTVDKNPHKQGRYLPGSHIPIESPEKIKKTKPDYVFILPWNLKDEIMEQMNFVRDWNCKFVIPIPMLKVI
ncbi:hypothetical protein DCCM_0484 [Desulfocucumis palustris]|uniref:Methyltransferase n=1 Tax=Desulfocucumis palustris TaxID=1898651 RepID=A0A2L2X8E3_9FIRM|nr:class I SAM-dependent methyltransferase [Desulfocucumis palustris]GBF32290.1 hypothetical protein DCCM_0484 [Desulfocucumis palustris]